MQNQFDETLVKEWLIETLPYEVMWMNESGNVVYANSKFCERLGYKKSEITRLTLFDINSTATKESWKEHWNIVEKQKTHRFKGTHKNKEGKYYEVEVYAQFFSNNGKKLICAIVNDISESSFYKKLMDNTETISNVGGWELNLQDGSLTATEEALRIFNTRDTEDLSPANIIHKFKHSEKLKDHLRGVMRKATSYDTVLETNENTPRFIRTVGKPIIKGDKVYKILGIYQDVTEQQIKENSLTLFKEVIDNAEDLIYVYDREGNLIHYSHSVIKQLGFTKKQLDKFNIFDLDPSITPNWWTEHFDEIIEKGSLRFEWLVVRKDGTKFPVDITANHLRFNNEDFNCAVIRDVTERKMRDLK
jgi:PAS domain S-box-containing protein